MVPTTESPATSMTTPAFHLSRAASSGVGGGAGALSAR